MWNLKGWLFLNSIVSDYLCIVLEKIHFTISNIDIQYDY